MKLARSLVILKCVGKQLDWGIKKLELIEFKKIKKIKVDGGEVKGTCTWQHHVSGIFAHVIRIPCIGMPISFFAYLT